MMVGRSAGDLPRIERPNFAFWLGEDGIVRLRYTPGRHFGIDDAKESVEAGLELFRVHPSPMIVFLDERRSMSREARNYVSRAPGPTAVGLVVSSAIARTIGGMFIGLLRQSSYPARIFATEEAAAKWLAEFVVEAPCSNASAGDPSGGSAP
jgi:hypothetical protein